MKVVEKLAELRVSDVSFSLFPKVEFHEVTVEGERDFLMECCFREDSHKFVKADLIYFQWDTKCQVKMTNRSISVGVKQLEGGFVESIRHTKAPLKRLGEVSITPFYV